MPELTVPCHSITSNTHFFQHLVPHTNTYNSKCHLLSGRNYSVGAPSPLIRGVTLHCGIRCVFGCLGCGWNHFFLRAETELGCRIVQTHSWIV